jgi:hypothetical protein
MKSLCLRYAFRSLFQISVLPIPFLLLYFICSILKSKLIIYHLGSKVIVKNKDNHFSMLGNTKNETKET